MTVPALGPVRPPDRPPAPDPLREAAVSLEASFLARMLEEAGMGRTPSPFGGQVETPFASFLVEAQAMRLARGGGIGLAESLTRALAAQPAPPGRPR